MHDLRRPFALPPLSATSSLSSSDDTHSSTHHHIPLLLRHPITAADPALPPPTTHHLPPTERTKLMRSTRKLGQLLGTTPYLTDALPPPAPPSKLFRRTPHPLAPPPPAPKFKPGHALRLSIAPPSPSSTAAPPSPTTPAPPPDRAAQRRIKMDKLKRTLGENVPVELVFATEHHDPPPPPLEEKKSVGLSLWRKASQGVLPAKPKPRPKPKLEPEQALTPEQRAISIRRAAKMEQVFGTPPPHALYQITNTAKAQRAAKLDDRAMAGLAYMLDHDCDSLYDLLSTVRSHVPEEHVDWPYERPHPSPSLPSPAMAPSLPPTPSPSLPPSPYPSPPTDPPDTPPFHARRKRAAKLARFFGVGYHDLYESMLAYPAVDPRPRPFLVPRVVVSDEGGGGIREGRKRPSTADPAGVRKFGEGSGAGVRPSTAEGGVRVFGAGEGLRPRVEGLRPRMEGLRPRTDADVLRPCPEEGLRPRTEDILRPRTEDILRPRTDAKVLPPRPEDGLRPHPTDTPRPHTADAPRPHPRPHPADVLRPRTSGDRVRPRPPRAHTLDSARPSTADPAPSLPAPITPPARHTSLRPTSSLLPTSTPTPTPTPLLPAPAPAPAPKVKPRPHDLRLHRRSASLDLLASESSPRRACTQGPLSALSPPAHLFAPHHALVPPPPHLFAPHHAHALVPPSPPPFTSTSFAPPSSSSSSTPAVRVRVQGPGAEGRGGKGREREREGVMSRLRELPGGR